jgi:D-alanine-D-alanine ligase
MSVSNATRQGVREASAVTPARPPVHTVPPLQIALLVNLASNAPPPPPDAPHDALAELDSDSTAAAYEQALQEGGHRVYRHEGGPLLPHFLNEIKPDLCFNTCEGLRGDSREAQVPALLEMLGMRYTGPTPLAAAITNDKPTTKRILHYYGLPTPLFQVFESPDEPLHRDLVFPLFVKPAHEGTGMGIGNNSLVRNVHELRDSVAECIHSYHQAALVESYIEGKDITCGLTGNGNDVHFFPITEVDFSGYPDDLLPIYGSLQKVEFDHLYKNKCPAPLGDALTAEVRRLTHQTFLVTGCRDYARVDFRLRDDGSLSILEINGLPGITPHSDMTLMAQAEGWTHGDLVRSVLHAGARRYGLAS